MFKNKQKTVLTGNQVVVAKAYHRRIKYLQDLAVLNYTEFTNKDITDFVNKYFLPKGKNENGKIYKITEEEINDYKIVDENTKKEVTIKEYFSKDRIQEMYFNSVSVNVSNAKDMNTKLIRAVDLQTRAFDDLFKQIFYKNIVKLQNRNSKLDFIDKKLAEKEFRENIQRAIDNKESFPANLEDLVSNVENFTPEGKIVDTDLQSIEQFQRKGNTTKEIGFEKTGDGYKVVYKKTWIKQPRGSFNLFSYEQENIVKQSINIQEDKTFNNLLKAITTSFKAENKEGYMASIETPQGKNLNLTSRKYYLEYNAESLEDYLFNEPELFEDLFTYGGMTNPYAADMYNGRYKLRYKTLVGHTDLNQDRQNINADEITKGDLAEIKRALKNNSKMYAQVVRDYSDKSRRYYAAAKLIPADKDADFEFENLEGLLLNLSDGDKKEEQKIKIAYIKSKTKELQDELKNIRKYHNAKTKFLVDNHNSDSDFSLFDVANQSTIDFIHKKYKLKDYSKTASRSKGEINLLGDLAFQQTIDGKVYDILKIDTHFKMMEELNLQPEDVVASMNYVINKYLLQDLNSNIEEENSFIAKTKRSTGFIAPHNSVYANNRVETLIFEDQNLSEENDKNKIQILKDGKLVEVHFEAALADSASYITEEEAQRLINAHGNLADVKGSFKLVGFGRNIDNKKIAELTGQKSNQFYMKGHTIVLNSKNTGPLKGVYNNLKKREQFYKDNKLSNHRVIAYADSGAKKFNIKGVNKFTLAQLNDSNFDINTSLDAIFFDEANNLRGFDGRFFGIQNELDKDSTTATMAKQAIASINAFSDSVYPELREGSRQVLQNYTDALNLQYQEDLSNTTFEELALQDKDNDSMLPIERYLLGEEITSLPSLQQKIQDLAQSKSNKIANKLRTKGTLSLQVSDIVQGFDLNDDGSLIATDDNLKSIRVTSNGVEHAEAIISQHMAKQLGITNKDLKGGKEVLFIATRIPASSAGSTLVLKVKKISEQPGNTIAINSKMSHIMGSDLDGDMLHINLIETGENLSELQIAKNKLVQSIIDLYSNPSIVSTLTKEIEFDSTTENTNKKLFGSKEGKSDINNDLSLLGTKNIYETTKGNVPMIGIIASTNLMYNYISEESPQIFFDQTPISFTFGNDVLTNINNDIKEDGSGTYYELTKYLNLILDDGQNNNREDFQFIKETSSMFTLMMKFGIKPEDISDFLVKTNYKAFKGLSTKELSLEIDDAFKVLSDENEKRKDTINRLFFADGFLNFDLKNIPSSTGNEVDELATIMYYVFKEIGNDLFSISQFVNMDKRMTINPIDALFQHQDGIQSLKRQIEINKSSASNNSFFVRNKNLSEQIIDKSIEENTSLNNGYFKGFIGKSSYEEILDDEGILSSLSITEEGVPTKFASIFNINPENTQKSLSSMNLARVLLHAKYNVRQEIKDVINEYKTDFTQQEVETFSDAELIEFSSVFASNQIIELQSEEKYFNNKWIGEDGILKVRKKPINYFNASNKSSVIDVVEISLDSIKLQQNLEFVENVLQYKKDFAKLPSNLQKFLVVNDLLKTGWGAKNASKSIIPYASESITNKVNNMFAKVKNEQVSNFEDDMLKIKDSLKHVVNFTDNDSVNNRRIALLMYLGVHGANANPRINKGGKLVYTNEFTGGLYNVQTRKIGANELNQETKILADNHKNYIEELDKKSVDIFIKNSFKYNNQFPELGMLNTMGALTTNDINEDGITYHDGIKKKYLKVSSNSRTFYGDTGVVMSSQEYAKLILPKGVDIESLKDDELRDFNLQYSIYEKSVEQAKSISKNLGTKLDNSTYRLDKNNPNDSKKILDARFEEVRNVYAQLRDDINRSTVIVNGEEYQIDAIAFDTLLRKAQTKFGNHIAEKQIADWEHVHGESFVKSIIDGKYKKAKDISHLKLWMSPGDFGKTKPAIAYINKNIKKTHMKYTRNLALVAKEMNEKLDKLFKSKVEEFGGELKMKAKKFYMNYMPVGTMGYNEILFGNFYEATTGVRKVIAQNGDVTYKDVSNLELKKSLFYENKKYGVYKLKRDGNAYKNLSEAEKDYIEMYVKYTNFYKELIKAKGLYKNTKGANYVANINANNWEVYHRRGLFGMYYQMFKGDAELNNIIVEAYNPITGEVEKLDYFSWKAIYMHAPGEEFKIKQTKRVGKRLETVTTTAESLQTMTGPQRILEFKKIQDRVEELWNSGKDDDNNDINVESPVNDIMNLESEEAVNRHVHKRSMTSSYLATHNIHQALNTYVRDFMFLHGNMYFNEANGTWSVLSWAGDDKALSHEEGISPEEIKANKLAFSGFNDKTAEIDAAINNLGESNPNAVAFLDKVVKKGFLLKQDKEGKSSKNLSLSDSPIKILGKQPETVVVNFFTQWTMYVALGFNIPAAIGNVAIGKYNAYRLAGGKALIKGESRFWGITNNGTYSNTQRVKARKMIDEFGILTYRAEEISEGIGTSSLSSLIFAPMVLAENNIQQSSFLGLLTQEQWDAYYIGEDGTLQFNEELAAKTGAKKLTREDIARLERKVIDVQGRGYSATDMRYIQLYSLGNMVMQFKRWFPTFLADRFKAEDVNDLGDMTIGSITASRKFIEKLTASGKLSKPKEFKKELNKLEPHVREGVMRVLYGTNGIVVASLLLAMSRIGLEDDEPQDDTSKFFEKLLGDMLLLGNVPKLSYMTNIPAMDTVENLGLGMYHLAKQTEYQRKAKYGDKGDLKAVAHFARLIPTALRGPLQLENKKDRNKRVLK